MTTHEQLMIHASGMYLTQQLPDDYCEWDDSKLVEFVGNHLTVWFENRDPASVLSEIEQAADHWWKFIAGRIFDIDMLKEKL